MKKSIFEVITDYAVNEGLSSVTDICKTMNTGRYRIK